MEITLTKRFEKVTLPADTDQHTLNIDAAITGAERSRVQAWIELQSGDSVQIGINPIDSESGDINTNSTRIILDCYKGLPIYVKGQTGSETFLINLIRP